MFLTFGSQQQTLENLCQTGVALEGQYIGQKSIIFSLFFLFNFERKTYGLFLCIFCITLFLLYPECIFFLKVHLMC